MCIKLIANIGRGLTLGAVFAHDVGALTPAALKLLDDGLREIAHGIVPRDSAQTTNHHHTLYTATSDLLNRVGLRMGAPSHMGDVTPRWNVFMDPKNDRNWRLENGLVGCRAWSYKQNVVGMAACLGFETFYHLLKFRGIDLNAPDPV